jgi:predicted PhzF superfamily epimerase YddE/YHI9
MKIPIYQVDAFTSQRFSGNPAAVCPLENWLTDTQMQKIAMENNLSETAFFVDEGDYFGLRWFTPTVEVDLCGHATLATAHVLFNHLNYAGEEIRFKTKRGMLTVRKSGDALLMNFPIDEMAETDPPDVLFDGLGKRSDKVFRSDDYMVVLDSENEVADLKPDFRLLSEVDARGIIVTAPGKEVDFVSRFFGPQSGVDEDPVTGSAHTKLAPYWAKVLGKHKMTARQISERGGELVCELKGDRVELQ